MKKVLLAYSGGLDTSVILKWLLDNGYKVVCVIADVGQQENLTDVKTKALSIGASKVHIVDLKGEFLENFIFKALKANVKYEGSYLLATALARPLISKKLADIAKQEKTNIIAHGATGKGNDQVRFELAIYHHMPNAQIIAPWRDPAFYEQFKGRTDLIKYANAHGIPITSTLEKPYSIDENLMHTSYEGGVIEDYTQPSPADMFRHSVSPEQAPDEITPISITFTKGTPTALQLKKQGKKVTKPMALFTTLQQVAGENGIGRIDIIESRVIGTKSRGIYESPAATVLWCAHADLEKLVLDKEVLKLKSEIEAKIAQLIYHGLWFSPEMDFLMAAINQSQQKVCGTIHLSLYKGSCWVTHRETPHPLHEMSLSSMDELGDYDQSDATGFIKTNALRFINNKGSDE